ncbi:MAG: hypothetical protein MJE68_01275, partial [Proteobacteria bacterium]|nr:hypothetical protein [Pseudomonadota bacterium]
MILLLIFSAPAMAAMILPQTNKYWKLWSEHFLREAFFAPTLLFLLAVAPTAERAVLSRRSDT